MSVAPIFNVPNDQNEWNEFSFALQDALRNINAAILRDGGPQLPEFPLDPIALNEPGVQLEAIQSMLDGVNQELGIAGFDYIDVDLSNKDERATWIWLLANNVRQAANQLGVG